MIRLHWDFSTLLLCLVFYTMGLLVANAYWRYQFNKYRNSTEAGLKVVRKRSSLLSRLKR